jgi:tetratricopeptide (TPR) repeat protein
MRQQKFRWQRIGSGVFAAVILAGCGVAEKQETLGDLGELDIKIDTESAIVDGRSKAMDNYWEFMAGAKQESQKVEALRRLADLEMERSEERLQKQMELFSQGGAGADTDPETLRRVTFRGAIKLYEDAIKVAGDGPQAVDLLYQLSNAYERAALPEKALDALTRMLAIDPRAANRDELQFRRGELLFGLQKFKPAELAYTQVLSEGPSSRYFEKAMNKRGWTLFKQEKYQQALKTFFELADRKLKPRWDWLRKES